MNENRPRTQRIAPPPNARRRIAPFLVSVMLLLSVGAAAGALWGGVAHPSSLSGSSPPAGTGTHVLATPSPATSKTPSILIISPGNNTVITGGAPVTITFQVSNFNLTEPVGQPNANDTGHVHVLVNGTYYELVYTEAPITLFLPDGWYSITLMLVNNNHTPYLVNGSVVEATVDVGVTHASSTAPPSIVILNPAAGGRNIVGEDFTVSFAVFNFYLTQPDGQPQAPNEGHVHVLLDGNYYELVSSVNPVPLLGIPTGEHVVTLMLVQNNHAPYTINGTPVEASVTVNVTDGPLPPSGTPQLAILSPATNSTVTGPDLTISFVVFNFLLVQPIGQPNLPNEGHIHVLVDGNYYELVSAVNPIVLTGLTGTHTITLMLVNNNHTPYLVNGSMVEATVTVTIVTPGPTPPTGTPSVAILNPSSGASVSGPDVTISFAVFNFLLVQPIGQANQPNEGHIHVLINGNYYELISTVNPVVLTGMEPGTYTVTLLLVNNNHTPYLVNGQNVSASVTITVTAPASGSQNTSGLATSGQITTTDGLAVGALILALVAALLAGVAARRSGRAPTRSEN